jgi:hypothetical protein
LEELIVVLKNRSVVSDFLYREINGIGLYECCNALSRK